MRFFFPCILLCFISGSASAQLFKCKDVSTGHITYSDSACPTTSKVAAVQAKRSTEEIAADYNRAEEARQRNASQFQAMQEHATESRSGYAANMEGTESQGCTSAKRDLKMHPGKDTRFAANLACLGAEATAKIEAAKAGNKSMRCVPDGFGNFNCK